jgi:hypothetical protein
MLLLSVSETQIELATASWLRWRHRNLVALLIVVNEKTNSP